MTDYPWHPPFRPGRCRTRLSRDDSRHYYGRCELTRGHDTSHALERGMFIVLWDVIPGTDHR